tara:strand:- start:412 stop:936 length:525 start_codon:yes stop_codon:yes gene_type:complete
MRRVSFNARTAFDAETGGDIEVALFVFEHALLPQPIRLSTDPTERLSTEPYMLGTRSNWSGANPVTDPYLFVLASAEVPGDMEDAPASATLVLENVDNEIASVLRSFVDYATVHMAVVLAGSPNLVEVEYRDMKLVSADGDSGEVRIAIGRHPIEDERVPMDRFTKDRFPGIYR